MKKVKTKIIPILTLSVLFITLSAASVNAQFIEYCNAGQCQAISYTQAYADVSAMYYVNLSSGVYFQGTSQIFVNGGNATCCAYVLGRSASHLHVNVNSITEPYKTASKSYSVTGSQRVWVETYASWGSAILNYSWN